jgi:hypothetical protein
VLTKEWGRKGEKSMKCVRRTATLCLAFVAAGSCHARAADKVAPVQKCAGLVNLKIAGTDVHITKADAVPAAPAGTVRTPSLAPEPIPVPIPSYCKVDGVIDPRIGFEGKSYAIGFEIALPDNWNGRFLFQGGGGLNGSIIPPLGLSGAGAKPGLARGFAVVSTDTGHKGAVFDASFMKDQLAGLDFAYIAVGRVTVVSKEIIAQYYGRPATRSYFAGCSTGGREGLLMSQRYPSYFDGIIVGDPAMRTGYSNIGLAWARRAFADIAPKDASGKPDPTKDFSSADKKLLADSIMKTCDELDGLKDGMIFNPRACHYDPAVLQCKGAKTESCLSTGQVGALKKAFAGPKDSRGNQVYAPFPWDTGHLEGMGGPFMSFLPSPGPNILASVEQPIDLSIDVLVDRVGDDEEQALTDTTWTNLSSFFGRGGKLVFYHGTSDPVFSAFDTLAYYEKMADANGGLGPVLNSSRFYFVPGMLHCEGGPATLDKFDLLGAVVDWVESGKVPDSVIAEGKAFPGRSRPLCAYPRYAYYKGQGDSESASSFECRQ